MHMAVCVNALAASWVTRNHCAGLVPDILLSLVPDLLLSLVPGACAGLLCRVLVPCSCAEYLCQALVPSACAELLRHVPSCAYYVTRHACFCNRSEMGPRWVQDVSEMGPCEASGFLEASSSNNNNNTKYKNFIQKRGVDHDGHFARIEALCRPCAGPCAGFFVHFCVSGLTENWALNFEALGTKSPNGG